MREILEKQLILTQIRIISVAYPPRTLKNTSIAWRWPISIPIVIFLMKYAGQNQVLEYPPSVYFLIVREHLTKLTYSEFHTTSSLNCVKKIMVTSVTSCRKIMLDTQFNRVVFGQAKPV